jgi:PEGA domain
VDTQDGGTAQGDAGDPAGRASLQLELHVPEQQMLAPLREAFLRWVTDRSGPFAPAIGPSERLAVDELPPAADPDGMSMLRLTVSWSAPAAAAEDASPWTDGDEAAIAVAFADEAEPPPASLSAPDRFVFFPEPPQAGAPLFREFPAPLLVDPGGPSQKWQLPHLELPERMMISNQAAAAVSAVQSFFRRAAAGLAVRFQALAGHRRGWGLGLLGGAAVATGFVAGSLYLSAMDRARPAVEPSAVPAATEAAQAPPAAPAPAAPQDVIPAPSLPPAPPPAEAAVPVSKPGPPEPAIPASRPSRTPDTEVATKLKPPKAPARPAPPLKPETRVVRAVEGDAASKTASRQTSRGTLVVKSEPEGAEVSINGVVQGRTPLTIRDVGAGSRVVRLDLPGYARWSWAVTVVADQRTPVTVKLQPEKRPD